METSVTDLRDHLANVLKNVEAGHEVRLTRDGKTVARILPVAADETPRPQAPDFAERLARTFPEGPLDRDYSTEILEEQRSSNA